MTGEFESPFEISEMFFSRTDSQGRILSGNKVFQRVSGYEWAEMVNKPHNMIRHPDMPKGVFHLFWSCLLQKKPVGAYVKNKAQDGGIYWVFALAVPLADGYLSVRIKPSSPSFNAAQSIYKELLLFEATTKTSPEKSHQELLKYIQKSGYKDYPHFMRECLLEELKAREVACGKGELKTFRVLELLKNASEAGLALARESQRIAASHKKNKFLPLNLEITSSSLSAENAVASLSVVASSYQKLMGEVQVEIEKFTLSAADVVALLEENQFLMSARHLLSAIVAFFKTELNDGTQIDIPGETQRLVTVADEYQFKAQESVVAVLKSLQQFSMVCASMRSSITGLEIMRLTGKIEAARIGSASEEISIIIDQLKKFQSLLLEVLSAIEVTGTSLHGYSKELMEVSA